MSSEPHERRLSDDAYDRIVDMIMSGRLSAGALVQERALASELGMSRTPLREALLLLEGEGILVREGPRALRVMTMDITRYMENLAIRRLLEAEAARLAFGQLSEPALDELEREFLYLLAEEDAGNTVSRDLVRRADEKLHSAISTAAGNRQLYEIVSNLRRKTHVFDLKNMPERFRDTCMEHIAIVNALRKDSTPEAAADAVLKHIAGIRESIIAKLLPR